MRGSERMDMRDVKGLIEEQRGGGRGRVGERSTEYLNAKIMPSYKDNQVVGRGSRKLDRKLGRVIIRLKPPRTEGRGRGRFREFGHFVRLWGLGHWTRA